jgi:hypothetical protein
LSNASCAEGIREGEGKNDEKLKKKDKRKKPGKIC